jgi:hypothetical protein
MAIIKEIIKTSKNITSRSEIVAEYSADEQYFSIWTHKAGDLTGEGTRKQNMQFDKRVANDLYEALKSFLLI